MRNLRGRVQDAGGSGEEREPSGVYPLRGV